MAMRAKTREELEGRLEAALQRADKAEERAAFWAEQAANGPASPGERARGVPAGVGGVRAAAATGETTNAGKGGDGLSEERTQEELEQAVEAPQEQQPTEEPGGEETAAEGQQEPAAPANGADPEVTLGAKSYRHLPVKLSQEAIAKLNHEAAEAADEIDDLEDSLKIVKGRVKSIQSSIEAAQQRITRLVRICDAGEEEREMECQEVLDYRDNSVRVVRLDTGETVGEPRAMRDDERQLALLPPEGEAPAHEPDEDRPYEEARDRAGEEPPEVELEEEEEEEETPAPASTAPEPRILAADDHRGEE